MTEIDSDSLDWRAKWIWVQGRVDTPNCYVYARREFRVGHMSSASARVSCSTEYRLYVNGRYLGRGPCSGPPNLRYFDEYDLTHALRRGKNVIAALCHNDGVDTAMRPASPGGFLCRIEIRENGDTSLLGTDETWKVHPGDDWDPDSPRIAPSLGFKEFHDTRAKPVGWNVVGFEDSGWEDAFVVGEPGLDDHLARRPIPPLREQEIFPERVVSCESIERADGLLGTFGDAALAGPGGPASITVDFGRELVGYPILRIRDGGRATVDLSCSVTPDDGEAPVDQADRVTLHGGRREWQAFGRRVFRYMRLAIDDMDAPLQIESVSVSSVGHPVEQVSMFECGDEPLNAAWRAGVHVLGLCMQDCYESDPLSDPVQRPCDARIMALANYHSFFDTRLAAKALHEFVAMQDADPAWVTMLHDYYLHTGDQSIVESLYPRLRSGLAASSGLQDYAALRDAAKLAAACGDVEEAIAWHERAEEARGASAGRQNSGDAAGFRLVEGMFREGRGPEALEMIRRANSQGGRRTEVISPVYFLPAEVLGVKRSLPGSPVAVIQPRPCGLSWARGRVQTHKGLVEVEWRSEVDSFELDITAPYGFIAALPVGRFTNPVIDEIDTSPETPERRAQRNYGWGSTIWRDREEHDPYLDWLDTQEAEPAPGYVRRLRCSTEGDYLWIRECPLTQVRYVVRESGVRC